MVLVGTTGTAAAAPPGPCDTGRGLGRPGSGSLVQRCWRCRVVAPRRRRQQQARVQSPQAALLDPPPFDPAKLSIEYLPGGREPRLASGRRYTLTHNDVTGTLQLSIGCEYNRRQLDGWYTRMLRDEILAEWRDTAPPVPRSGGSSVRSSDGEDSRSSTQQQPRPSLHVFCHVSGEELWPAPPQLRSFIFQREMALVLDTIAHAEGAGGLLAAAPHLLAAPVYVHLRSDIPALDRVLEWGVLGDRATWRSAQSTVMRSLLSSVLGTMDEEADAATDGSDGSWSRSSFSASSGAWEGGEWDSGSSGSGSSGSWDDGPPGAGGGGNGGGGGQQKQLPTSAAAAPPQPASSSSSVSGERLAAASSDGAPSQPATGKPAAGSTRANGAVASPSWLSGPTTGDGRQLMPAAEVVLIEPASSRPR